ncbi:unnamed protein product [Urochloa humidicola]
MMQRRWQHGSSGELDVFGATSYFAGGLPDDLPSKPAERLIQESKVRHVTSMEDEQLGLHDDEGHAQLGRVANKPTGKSKLAALLMSFVVSPSSARASFRKESAPPPPEASNKTMLAASDESSSLSSRESSVQGCGGVHELDLGVAMGDRRLQGVRIVRGSGEERWVVRCSAWEERSTLTGCLMLQSQRSQMMLTRMRLRKEMMVTLLVAGRVIAALIYSIWILST